MKACQNFATNEFRNHIDKAVHEELVEANIPALALPSYLNSEVKTHYIGILNGFIFSRAWRYWVCEGDMPFELAAELYARHKELMIRVHGHAANPEPTLSTSYSPAHDAKVRDTMKFMQSKGASTQEILHVVSHMQPDEESPRYVRAYHIDTIEGLAALAAFIRTNNIYACNGVAGSYAESIFPNREKVQD